LGAIVTFAAFDIRVASAAFSMTVLGDIGSALVGRKFGRHKFIFSNKTWEGTFAGFLFNIAAGYFFLSGIPNQWVILLSMSTVASFVEVFTQKLDDNLTVPIFAGMAGQVVMLILGSYEVFAFVKVML
jgi:dolichol kinase